MHRTSLALTLYTPCLLGISAADCGHVLSFPSEIHFTRRLASEVSMAGENCAKLQFSLKALEITSEWEEMPDPWACGGRDSRREQWFSGPFALGPLIIISLLDVLCFSHAQKLLEYCWCVCIS